MERGVLPTAGHYTAAQMCSVQGMLARVNHFCPSYMCVTKAVHVFDDKVTGVGCWLKVCCGHVWGGEGGRKGTTAVELSTHWLHITHCGSLKPAAEVRWLTFTHTQRAAAKPVSHCSYPLVSRSSWVNTAWPWMEAGEFVQTRAALRVTCRTHVQNVGAWISWNMWELTTLKLHTLAYMHILASNLKIHHTNTV